jgi:hypothetical protein
MKDGLLKNIRIVQENHYSLYDVALKKLIGVFDSLSSIGRYVHKDVHNSHQDKKVYMSWRNKGKFKWDNMVYTVRTATKEQIEMLGDKQYVIFNGYRIPNLTSMKGLDTLPSEFNIIRSEKLKRYLEEKKRIQNKIK